MKQTAIDSHMKDNAQINLDLCLNIDGVYETIPYRRDDPPAPIQVPRLTGMMPFSSDAVVTNAKNWDPQKLNCKPYDCFSLDKNGERIKTWLSLRRIDQIHLEVSEMNIDRLLTTTIYDMSKIKKFSCDMASWQAVYPQPRSSPLLSSLGYFTKLVDGDLHLQEKIIGVLGTDATRYSVSAYYRKIDGSLEDAVNRELKAERRAKPDLTQCLNIDGVYEDEGFYSEKEQPIRLAMALATPAGEKEASLVFREGFTVRFFEFLDGGGMRKLDYWTQYRVLDPERLERIIFNEKGEYLRSVLYVHDTALSCDENSWQYYYPRWNTQADRPRVFVSRIFTKEEGGALRMIGKTEKQNGDKHELWHDYDITWKKVAENANETVPEIALPQ
jgi:hypothetical protein